MPIIGNYKYEIDEENAIRVWDVNNPDELNRPFMYQPDYPDQTPFENKAAAEKWIKDLIVNWSRIKTREELIAEEISKAKALGLDFDLLGIKE